MNSEEIKNLIELVVDDKKGEKISTIDLRDKGSFTDYIVIASAGSNRQLGAIAEALIKALKERDIYCVGEGLPNSDWVVIDAIDVVVHLFKPETRDYYNLEKMWKSDDSHSRVTTL